jgi:glutamate-1-semialdehyde 2,1-aminomutase
MTAAAAAKSPDKTTGTLSAREFDRSRAVIAGGVNSPVRAFKAMGGTPIFFKRGKGAVVTDVDGRRYIDFCMSWGALLFGHADPAVARAVAAQARLGTSFGAATPQETRVAEKIRRLVPSCERLRFTSSGTEAAMSAIRLARGATGKARIIKFEGCYHGHADALLVKAGSGLATFGHPSSAGVPELAARHTLVLPFNDADAVRRAFDRYADIACVAVEPVAGNMGVVLPEPGFLQTLRALTQKHKALLIFDEVITGFRVAAGGAQNAYNVRPDLTVMGKIIGGGLPMGVFGGSEKVMRLLAPDGPVYQAGTLSGNPLAMAAGLSVLDRILTAPPQEKLEARTARFAAALRAACTKKGLKVSIPTAGSMFGIFFQPQAPLNFAEITPGHVETYKKFFWHMIGSGVYVPPSAYEAFFLSTAHTDAQLEKVLQSVRSFG